jgi:hypothetical protein
MFKVISYYSENYQPLVDKTWHQNKVPYCQRHNYLYENYLEKWSSMRECQNIKIDILKKNLESLTSNDWLWWTGADLMVTNWTIKLEDIVDTNYHFIVASDFNGINADSFLIRGSDEGKSYLAMIANTLINYENWEGEQGIMKDTYEQYKNTVVKLVPQKLMNSYNYAVYRGRYPEPLIDKLGTVGDWSIGDFVIQWPATDLNFRLRAFDYYSNLILK